jgi:hypothetical protein
MKAAVRSFHPNEFRGAMSVRPEPGDNISYKL